MKELLKRTNIRKNPRAIKAYWGLLCGYSDDCEIPAYLSTEKIAWEMRNACERRAIAGENINWGRKLEEITGNDAEYNIRLSDPVSWIQAAVLCYEELKK